MVVWWVLFRVRFDRGQLLFAPPDQIERFREKFHKAEILLGFRGDGPVTLKVEPKQKNATPEKLHKPPSQER